MSTAEAFAFLCGQLIAVAGLAARPAGARLGLLIAVATAVIPAALACAARADALAGWAHYALRWTAGAVGAAAALAWTAFFLLQPVLIAAERRLGVRHWPAAAAWVWTAGTLLALSPLMTPRYGCSFDPAA